MTETLKPRLNRRSFWCLVAIPTAVVLAGFAGFLGGEIYVVHMVLGVGLAKALFILWHCDDDRFQL
jgi:hypothetical protein